MLLASVRRRGAVLRGQVEQYSLALLSHRTKTRFRGSKSLFMVYGSAAPEWHSIWLLYTGQGVSHSLIALQSIKIINQTVCNYGKDLSRVVPARGSGRL